jgi:hypothetical protein
MSFADLLDGAFRLLRANLATIVLVTAVFIVPLQLISAFLSRDLFGGRGIFDVIDDPSLAQQSADSDVSAIQLFGTGSAALIGLLITPFVGGVITKVVSASYLGQQLSAGQALRATARRFGALLMVAILVHLVELVGFVLLILPSLVAMAFYICTTPAVMVEELGPIKAMRRSFALVRRRFWPVLGIAVVSGLMAFILSYILGSPFTFAGQAIGLHWGFILVAIGRILPALVATPFVTIVATLIYFDARIRHEGFDLQMMARGIGGGEAPTR